MNNGHWQYPIEIDAQEWFGFVYRIIELNTGREYIGKKQLKMYTKKKIKDRKNRKTVIKESAWRKYTGSSTELNTRIKEHGMSNYCFLIESLHKTRGTLFYSEVEKHVMNDVLRARMEDGVPKFFNKNISGVKFIPPTMDHDELAMDVTGYDMSDRSNTHDITVTQILFEDYYGKSSFDQLKKSFEDKSNKS